MPVLAIIMTGTVRYRREEMSRASESEGESSKLTCLDLGKK